MRGLPSKIIEHKTSGKVPESASESHPEMGNLRIFNVITSEIFDHVWLGLVMFDNVVLVLSCLTMFNHV